MGRSIKHRSSPKDERAQCNEEESQATSQSVNENDKRVIVLSGTLTEQNSTVVITKIISMSHDDSSPIKMIINTYGGYTDECMAIYDAMKFSRAPIVTVGLGKIMSAGVPLLAAGAKGSRFIGRSARIMIHRIHSGAEGDPFHLQNEINEIKRIEKTFTKIMIKETKIKKKTLDDILNARIDYYVTPQEAIRLGIADQITP